MLALINSARALHVLREIDLAWGRQDILDHHFNSDTKWRRFGLNSLQVDDDFALKDKDTDTYIYLYKHV